jgi:putative transposase
VMTRGNRRERLFDHRSDMVDFATLLGRTVQRFQYIIHLFCFMENHFHLTIETPHANLSQIMHYQNSVFAQRQNKRRGIDGHVTQGRFKAILVEEERYYFTLVRYTHINPVPALVRHEDDYEFSSHQAIINPAVAERWSSWYDPWAVLSRFGATRKEALRNYRKFMKRNRTAPSPFEQMTHPYILGSDEFQKRILSQHEQQIVQCDNIAHAHTLKHFTPWKEVIDAVCHEYRVCPVDLLVSCRGRHRHAAGRSIAIALAAMVTGLTHKVIGQLFGGVSGPAVAHHVMSMRRRLDEMPELRAWVDYLLALWGHARCDAFLE